MNHNCRTSQRSNMTGTFNPQGLYSDASTQMNVDDFDLTKDYWSTSSSSEGSYSESQRIPMSSSGKTRRDESWLPETNPMMPLNLTYAHHCEGQSSFNFFISEMVVLPPVHLSVSPLAVQPSVMKVEHHLQLQIPAVECAMKRQSDTVQDGAHHQKPFQNYKKSNKSSDKSTRAPLFTCSSTSDNYSIGDSNTHLSPVFCKSVPCMTTCLEVPPVLNLLNQPVEFAFPDDMSCVISERPDRLGVRKSIKPIVCAPKSPRNLQMNVRRTVVKRGKEPLETVAPCWKSLGDEK